MMKQNWRITLHSTPDKKPVCSSGDANRRSSWCRCQLRSRVWLATGSVRCLTQWRTDDRSLNTRIISTHREKYRFNQPSEDDSLKILWTLLCHTLAGVGGGCRRKRSDTRYNRIMTREHRRIITERALVKNLKNLEKIIFLPDIWYIALCGRWVFEKFATF